jgi:cytochrome c2
LFSRNKIPLLLVLCLFYPLSLPLEAAVDPVVEDYRKNCYSCHTIGGGRLSGPDLKDVLSRKGERWLVDFIVNPKAMIDSGDPYALKLVRESNGQVMPTVSGMTKQRAELLLDLIMGESKKEKSTFAGLKIGNRPVFPKDIEHGRNLFMGIAKQKSGGPACIACHSVSGIGAFGGGKLGPDLTRVFERMRGRNGLAAWLSAPSTATMKPVYANYPIDSEEIFSFVAYFEDLTKKDVKVEKPSNVNFLLAGIGGSIFLLFLFDFVWRRRFRSVRSKLVSRFTRGDSGDSDE